jgi:hypothetical protein
MRLNKALCARVLWAACATPDKLPATRSPGRCANLPQHACQLRCRSYSDNCRVCPCSRHVHLPNSTLGSRLGCGWCDRWYGGMRSWSQNCVRCHARTSCLGLHAATKAHSQSRQSFAKLHACWLPPASHAKGISSRQHMCCKQLAPVGSRARAHQADAPCGRLSVCFPQQPPWQLCEPKLCKELSQVDLSSMTLEQASVCAGRHHGRWSPWGLLLAACLRRCRRPRDPLSCAVLRSHCCTGRYSVCGEQLSQQQVTGLAALAAPCATIARRRSQGAARSCPSTRLPCWRSPGRR